MILTQDYIEEIFKPTNVFNNHFRNALKVDVFGQTIPSLDRIDYNNSEFKTFESNFFIAVMNEIIMEHEKYFKKRINREEAAAAMGRSLVNKIYSEK